mmetsp:Transcript_99383/g.290090  ORF Transcript_99383/g.290090 Transcript_99383/m.290090 type:complete len:110 (-) Transcript_99383:2034-2363(-)
MASPSGLSPSPLASAAAAGGRELEDKAWELKEAVRAQATRCTFSAAAVLERLDERLARRPGMMYWPRSLDRRCREFGRGTAMGRLTDWTNTSCNIVLRCPFWADRYFSA